MQPSRVLIPLAFLFACFVGRAEEEIALIYNGPAADPYGAEAVAALAEKAGLDPVFFRSFRKLPDLLEDASVLIVGGTEDDLDPILREATPRVRKAVKEFIAAGGRYLGICGGAYVASAGWPDTDRFVKALGLVAVKTDDFTDDDEPQIIRVQWKGRKRSLYFQYGPQFLVDGRTAKTIHKTAFYSDGSLAALWMPSGKGRIYLCGPHPEADESWLEEEDGSTIRNHSAWRDTDDLAEDMMNDLLAD
ncbi:MAG TPA: BPL-N domain-containing protein [Kiritimatiellia bacterium]|nr:BPL-N domain-containing protein [Kiritimatiellia bacterium]HRZ11772.1 BPL-N domain-containing protein [Kiritimatiellia bacterium]HSA17421.1 BPL-N domain-containing protein [Kiritimatiellia bacterium]